MTNIFRHPAPNPVLTARVAKIHKVLADIEITSSIRETLIHLGQEGGHYCASCSPKNVLGACGSTCALLRPTRINYVKSGEWATIVYADNETYYHLVKDMNNAVYAVKEAKVRKWEVTAEMLRQSTMSKNDCRAEDWGRHMRHLDPDAVLTPGWRFEERWGMGQRPHMEVAPEDS